MLIALALLIVAGGFCFLDGDGGMHEHAIPDLCLGMLVTSLTMVVVAGLPLTGLTAVYRLAPVFAFSPRVPAPPPKSASLA
jgi:hypothetical protein